MVIDGLPHPARVFASVVCCSLWLGCDPAAPPPDADGQDDGLDDDGDDVLPAAAAIGMNDVSILFPLVDDGDGLWPVTLAGRHGPLLDAEAYAPVAPLVRGVQPPLDALRVVSLRLDPCFVDGGVCVPMVRIVAQPRALDGAGFEDAAIHLHYPLPETGLAALLDEIAAARQASGVAADAPLGVHPALLTEGLGGAFGLALQTSLLAQVGLDRLERITFTTRTLSRAAQWEWGRVDRVATGFARVAMPASGTAAADVQVLIGDDIRAYAITPSSPTAGALATAFALPTELGTVPEGERVAVVSRITDVLHPERESPESVDCASCHVAPHLDRDARASWPDVASASTAYASSLLRDAPTTPRRRDQIRAFGYLGDEPQINRRTVNETAYVVESFRRGR